MSSSNSPCAACKFQRRKCTQECVLAPYFPPDQLQKFANVHKVFGASNVTKLLNELSPNLREDAVNSLAYEAKARLHDPVYGCVGMISILQHRLKQVQSDLYNAKKELSTYIGPQAMMPMLQAQTFMPQQHLGNPSSSSIQHGMLPMMGIPTGSSHSGQLMIRDPQHPNQHHQQQQIFEAQQLAAAVAAREQQEMMRNYEHQQQQHQQQQQELVRFNSGYDAPAGTVTPSGFNQLSAAAMSPSLALGSFDNPYQMQAQQQPEPHHHATHSLQAQLLLQSQQGQTPPQKQQAPQTQQQQKSGSEEGRSVGPAC